MNIKKKSILILVLLLAIGFASITTTLIINGVANIGFNEDDFGVIFTYANISNKKASKATISDDKKTITFKTGELSKKGETSILDYTVKNISTQYDATAKINCTAVNSDYVKLKNVIDSRDITNMDDESDPIKLAINEAKNGKLTVEVIKSYLGDDKLDIPVTCTMEVTPIEPDDDDIPTTSTTTGTLPNVERVVKIDPNGGLYKNSANVYVTDSIETGSTYEIEEVPTREGYRFIGWQVSEEGVYNQDTNIVTMKQDDIVLIANWEAVDNVARIEDTMYPSIQSAIKDARKDDVIYLLKDTTENPVNNKEVTLDLGGHKVTGTLINEKTITIINGTIESTTSSAVINNGTLTLGENDLDEDDNPKVSVDSVALIGINKGLEQNGVFNFYDGYIEGSIGIAGGYNDKPVGYIVFVDHNDEKDCQKVYLIEEKYVSRAVAKTIDTGDIYYFNLQDALNTTFDNEMVVYAIRNFEAPHTITIPEGSTGVFDITGYTVETGYTITNNGEFTLRDSATEKGILKPSVSIINNGLLHIKDIEITETTNANIIENNGELDIKNSIMTALKGFVIKNISGTVINMDENAVLKSTLENMYINGYLIFAIENVSSNKLTISGGNVYGLHSSGPIQINSGNHYNVKAWTIYLTAASTIKNLSLTSTEHGIYSSADLTIDNAHIEYTGTLNNKDAVYSVSGKLIINNVDIDYYNGIEKNSGQFDFNGGNIIAKYYGIKNNNAGPLNINGGTITSQERNGIYLGSTTANINGGTISGKDAGIYADQNYSQGCKLYVNSGNISGNYGIHVGHNLSKVYVYSGNITGTTYGVYNEYGLLEIGKDDNNIKDIPKITGGFYGVYINNKTNYYDGELSGKTDGYFGTFNLLPDGTSLSEKETTINGEIYKTNFLSNHENFVKIGTTEYNSLQKAINAIETEGTINIFKNSTINSKTEISSSKNIVIDLNGFELNITGEITNNGNLTITDSSQEKTGKIVQLTDNNIITNVGTLTIDNGKFYKNKVSNNGIYNETTGVLTINDIYLETEGLSLKSEGELVINKCEILQKSTSNGGVILLSGSKKVNISNCKLTSNYEYGIKNTGTHSEFKLTNVEINANSTSNGVGINNEYGPAILENVNIISKKYGISNNGNTTIKSGTINANVCGIMANGSGVLKIEGGTITSPKTAIENYGNLIIGEDDDNISTTTPLIIGDEKTINSGKNVKFYDGILKSVININNCALIIPDGTSVIDGEEIIDSKTYKTKKIKAQDMIVKVGTNEFNSLQKAIDFIETEGTIEFLLDASSGSIIKIPSDKSIIIDLAGKTYTINQKIENNGTLTINDSSTEKNGSIVQTSSERIIDNKGTLIIENGKFYKSNSEGYGIYNNSGATLTINDMYLESDNESLYNIGELTINKATIKQDKFDKYALFSSNPNTVIKNTKINAYSGIRLQSTTTTNILLENLDITAEKFGINTLCPQGLEMRTIKIDSEATGIVLNDSGTINLTNANITAKNNGITVYSNVKFTLDGGTVSGDKYGIEDSTAEGYTHVKSGTVSGNLHGIYFNNNGDNAKTNMNFVNKIGEKDGNVNNNSPIIIGGLYGIYVRNKTNLSFAFYDGKVKGKTGAYNMPPVEVENNKYILFDTENIIVDGNEETYNVIYLDNEGNVVSNNGTPYINLQTAIDSANSGDTLTIMKDSFISYPITVDKEITINFNGKDVKFSNMITNNSTLYLKNLDTSNTTHIDGKYRTYFLTNNGTLNVDNLNIETYLGIMNNGTVSINNTTITASGTAINNTNNMVIDNSQITGTSYSLYNNSTVDNTIQNNTILNGKVYLKNTNTTTFNDVNINGEFEVSEGSTNVSYNRGTVDGKYINTGTSTINDTNFVRTSTSAITDYNFIDNRGTINITGMNLTHENKLGLTAILNKGTLNLSNSTIKIEYNESASAYIIKNKNLGILNIRENIFTVTNGNTVYGIYNESSTTSTHIISKNNINLQGQDMVYGIYNKNSKIDLSEGTLNLTSQESPSQTTTAYGIYNYNSVVNVSNIDKISVNSLKSYGIYVENGEVTLGEKDGNVSTTIPYVEAIGTNTGIGVKKVNGLFKYYDGKILGSTSAKPDTTTDTETYYEATFYHDANNYEYCILELLE